MSDTLLHSGDADEQEAGRYRLRPSGDATFGHAHYITWCPAGIDLTEEVRELRRTARAKEERRGGDA